MYRSIASGLTRGFSLSVPSPPTTPVFHDVVCLRLDWPRPPPDKHKFFHSSGVDALLHGLQAADSRMYGGNQPSGISDLDSPPPAAVVVVAPAGVGGSAAASASGVSTLLLAEAVVVAVVAVRGSKEGASAALRSTVRYCFPFRLHL